MLPWIALGLLVPVALVLLMAWRRYLSVVPHGTARDRMISAVWAPLVASGGLLGVMMGRDGTLGSEGAAAIGMGAMVAAVVVGCVLLSAVLRIQRDPWEAQDRLPLAWPVAGVLLVLVASAGRVSHTVGLVAFAIGVVLIWANSLPEPAEEGASSAQQPSGAESAWLTMAFAAAILLGVCTALATEVLVATVIMVAALVALAVVATVGRCRDGQLAIRSAGWLAVILPCLGLGLLGHDRLMLIMQGGRIPQLPGPPPRLHETGGLLLPGLVLLATTAVLAGHGRWRGSWRLAACAGLGLAGVLGAGVMVAGVLG